MMIETENIVYCRCIYKQKNDDLQFITCYKNGKFFCEGALATAILRLALSELKLENSKIKTLNLFELFEKIVSNETLKVSQTEIDLSELFFKEEFLK